MARSYKSVWAVSDYGPSRRYRKRHANRAVRHAQDVPSGGAYHKLCPWRPKDRSEFFYTRREAEASRDAHERWMELWQYSWPVTPRARWLARLHGK